MPGQSDQFPAVKRDTHHPSAGIYPNCHPGDGLQRILAISGNLGVTIVGEMTSFAISGVSGPNHPHCQPCQLVPGAQRQPPVRRHDRGWQPGGILLLPCRPALNYWRRGGSLATWPAGRVSVLLFPTSATFKAPGHNETRRRVSPMVPWWLPVGTWKPSPLPHAGLLNYPRIGAELHQGRLPPKGPRLN